MLVKLVEHRAMLHSAPANTVIVTARTPSEGKLTISGPTDQEVRVSVTPTEVTLEFDAASSPEEGLSHEVVTVRLSHSLIAELARLQAALGVTPLRLNSAMADNKE